MAVDVIRIDVGEMRLPRAAQRAGHAVDVARSRLWLAALVFALAFIGIGARLADLMAFSTPESAIAGGSGGGAGGAAPAGIRADIVDRNGVMLATTLPAVSLYADPKLVLDPIGAALKLTEVLPDLDTEDLIAELASDKRFIWIRRGLTPRQQYEVNRLGLPGLAFLEEQRRYYPAGDLTAHILGTTDIDGHGIAGVEQSMDKRLAAGGDPLMLSIDLRVQETLRTELAKSIAEFSAIGGAAMVMDVRTGEVVGMVSLPDYNPYDRGNIPDDALFNRLTLGVYEMGSTFKIFNTAMALESGTSVLSSVYDTVHPIRVGRFTITDSHPESHNLDVVGIFTESSNIGSVRMMEAAGIQRQQEFLARMGLTRQSPIELPEVGSPMIPNPWREINAMTIAYGHGMAVSPMQMASAVSAIVNGGILYPATILRREGPPEGTRVVSPAISDIMRRLMRAVVMEGTGKKADAEGYLVGGKTGSAEKTAGNGYARSTLRTSFAGAFPMNDPQYMVFALLDEPHATSKTYGFTTAGWNAAPLVSRIVEALGPMLGVAPVDPKDPAVIAATAISTTMPAGPLNVSLADE